MGNNQQQGFALTGGNLTMGSRGEDVKALQAYLAGMGFKDAQGKPLKPDGIYGPNTKAAVMQFQKANGLNPDGIVGPKTTASLNKIQTTGDVPQNNNLPWLTPELRAKLTPQEIETLGTFGADFINQNKQKGFTINPNTTIDENTAKKFWDQATKEMHPVYAEQIRNEIGQAERDAELLSKDYQNTLATQGEQFGTMLERNRNELAKSGGGMSSARMKMEQDLMNQENRNREIQDLAYQNKLGNVGRTMESQIGAKNVGSFQLPNVASSRVGLTGVGGSRQGVGTLGGNWQQGTFKYGAIPKEEQIQTGALSDYYINQANAQYGEGRNLDNLLRK